MSACLQDGLIALGRLRRHRGSSLAITLLLALAMAVAACVVTMAYNLLWKPLPYPEQQRLVRLDMRSLRMGIGLGWSLPYLDAVALGSRQLASVAAYQRKEVATFGPDDGFAGTHQALLAEPGLARLIGVRPEIGRLFEPEDARPGAAPVVLIGAALWKARFARSAAVLGQSLRIDRRERRIVGVLPDDLAFPVRGIELWLPLGFTPAERALDQAGSFGSLGAIGRLAVGGSPASASAEMQGLTRIQPNLRQIAEEIELAVTAEPLRQVWVGEREPALRSLLLAAAMLFAVSLANVANLFLLRLRRRRQEQALLVALGAGWARLRRQIGWEALALALAGAGIGAALVPLGLAVLGHFDVLPADTPQRIGFDTVTVFALFALAAVAAAALAASGFLMQRQDAFQALRQGSGQTADPLAQRVRQVLVVGQLAATFVLLFCTALLAKSASQLLATDLGFDRSGLLVGRIQPGAWADGDDRAMRAELARWVAAVEALPEVQAVALSSSAPFGDIVSLEPFSRPGAAPSGDRQPEAYLSYVSAAYFAAVGMPLRQGRPFSTVEAEQGARVAVIDSRIASRYFPGRDPLGQTLEVNDGGLGIAVPVTIVGVVNAARQRNLMKDDGHPSIYLPSALPFNVHGIPVRSVEVLVRSRGALAATALALQAALGDHAPGLRLDPLLGMQGRIADTLIEQIRLNALLQVLAAISLLLAAAGLYALLSQAVLMRSREFAIRQSLGASPRQVQASVLAQGAGLLLLALLVGLLPALLLARQLQARLHGLNPYDPGVLALVGAVLLIVALAANLVPAYRASRVQPNEALRGD